MKTFDSVKSVTFRTTEDSPQLFVSHRCRLRMVIARSGLGRDIGTQGSLELQNGENGAVLYEVKAYAWNDGLVPAGLYAVSEPVDMGQHGILFSEGIWAEYTDSTGSGGVWCDPVTLLYS